MYDARKPAASATSAPAATAGRDVRVTQASAARMHPSKARSENDSATRARRSPLRSNVPPRTRHEPATSAAHPAARGSRAISSHAETTTASIALADLPAYAHVHDAREPIIGRIPANSSAAHARHA